MPINLQNETLLSFAELAKTLPSRREGRPVHPSTIHRWRNTGLSGVKLEAVRVGGAWCTSWEAFSEFCAQLTAAETGEDDFCVTASSQHAQHRAADQRLAKDDW